MEDKKDNKRREFLKTLGIIGAAGASGAMALYFGQQYEKIKSGKKVRLLTVDNKVVEFENGELKEFKGTIVLVSHEPEFYEDWVTNIWSVEDWTTKIV